MLKQISYILLHSQHKFPQQLMKHVCHNTVKIQGIMTFKKFHRNFHVCRKREQGARHSYPRTMSFSYCIYHKIMNSVVCFGNRQSCRFYSSMKDDDMIKSWLSEIKDDFEKGSKVAAKDNETKDGSSGESSSSSSDDDSESDVESIKKTSTDDLPSGLENHLGKLEKLGFTTEEIIDLLKNAKKLDENLIEDEYELSDSESENEQLRPDESINGGSETADDKKQGNGQKGAVEDSTNKMEKEEWAVVKMKPDVKTDWSVVEIEDFVNFAEVEPDIEEAWEPPVDLVRGKTGVYDIAELIEVLRAANAQDLITIYIPPELDFADYIVIASAKSQRHMQAITSDVKWIYKKKKHESDRFLKVEGEKSDWYAIDLGNIVLHIFMPATRELYDLETLWTVGVKFDPQCAAEPKDPYVFSVDDLPWLKELEQASENLDPSQNHVSNDFEKTRRKH